ncbi:complement factor B-like [Nothoprocta perdicaria]|uniref:complement factor B-like n=1 Tax=Nothoprocta perdicaria TaxID=30464 RepID=UPI000E1C0792|nr:complement factor B-like [Nothoprocta perdicaria]
MYVFGLGAAAHVETLNALASHKEGERHVFLLRDLRDLHETFQRMIDESETLSMCGLAYDFESAADEQRNPWHAAITVTVRHACAGRGSGTRVFRGGAHA